MSKFILPLDHMDFSAVLAEIGPNESTNSVEVMSGSWHQVSYILVDTDNGLTKTKEMLASLNVTPLSFMSIERDGEHVFYQAAHWPAASIMIPLNQSGSFMSVYYVPIDAEKTPDGSYFEEDCEFIERYSLDIPLYATSFSRRENYNLAYSLEVPEGEKYKGLCIFFQEPEDLKDQDVFKPDT